MNCVASRQSPVAGNSNTPDLLALATELFLLADVPEPRVDAEWLLAHVLGVRRDRIWTEADLKINSADESAFRALLERRCRREPLQYIIGTQEFYGRNFRVTPDVLIPRPETELLVEEAVGVLKKHPLPRGEGIEGRVTSNYSTLSPTLPPQGGGRTIRVLDVGTGSGCIAITLALELPTAYIVAIDRSTTALDIASQNAATHQAGDHITFIEADFTGDRRLATDDCLFDLIISNPPYCPVSQWPTLMPEVRDYEPREALVAGEDGLDFIRVIINHAPRYLKPGGWLLMEIGDGQATEVVRLIRENSLYKEARVKSDYNGIDRIVSAKIQGARLALPAGDAGHGAIARRSNK